MTRLSQRLTDYMRDRNEHKELHKKLSSDDFELM